MRTLLCGGGKCVPGEVHDPANWDALMHFEPGEGLAAMFSFPREKSAKKYRLSAAGLDDPGLMPVGWRLSGSRDGKNWVELDFRYNEKPWSPGEHRDYPLPEDASYAHYLLQVIDEGAPRRHAIGSVSFHRFGTDMNVPAPDGSVVAQNYSANSVEFQVKTPPNESRWFVYLDNATPGWRVFVDGRPVPMHVANLAFKTVPLTPGEHLVRFEYLGEGWVGLELRVIIAVSVLFTLWLLLLIASIIFPRAASRVVPDLASAEAPEEPCPGSRPGAP